MRFEIPQKLAWLFDGKARYRVAYGGRGSAKSYGAARTILARAIADPGVYLCAREFQNSIRDSVHALLVSQITACGMEDYFEWGESYINSKTGSNFIFKGLRHNIQSIKSIENIKVAWIEEAQTTSAASLEILIPTVRAEDSEIWLTFNPENEDDPVYKRFVLNTPENARVVEINYKDNPWFPQVLEAERVEMQRTDTDAYAHIWDGKCRKASALQVFKGKWHVEDFPDEIPADANGCYYGVDWGFSNDPTAIVRCYIHAGRLYITHEAYQVGCEIDKLPDLFDTIPGIREHVLRADSARPETISYMKRAGFNICAVDKWPGSVKDGITRMKAFEDIVVHPRCRHMADELRLYSYKADSLTGDPLPDIIDKHNHLIDGCRYALQPIIRARAKIMIGRA